MQRTIRRALMGSSMALAVVIGTASLVGAVGDLGDQLSATPLPILTSSSVPPTSPSVPPTSPPPEVLETVASALPNIGEVQNDGGEPDEEGPPPSAPPPTTPAPTVAVRTHTPGDADEDDDVPAASSPASSTSPKPMPTYGGIKYNSKAAASSSGLDPAGVSEEQKAAAVGPVGESSLGAAADTNGDGLVDEVEAAAFGEAKNANSDSAAADDPRPEVTVTQVPGFEGALALLVLLGGAGLLARRLRA